jgi:O-antigen ligase
MFLWFTLVLAAAVSLALVTQTGALGYNLALAGVLAVIGGMCAVAFQVRRPFVGMAALVVSAAALPLHLGGSGQANAPLALAALVCVCWLAREVVLMRRLELHSSPVVGATIALMAAAIASFFAGQIDWYSLPGAGVSAQIGGLTMFLLSGGLLLAVAHQIRSVAELKTLTYLFLAAGSVVPFLMLSPKLDILAAPTIAPITIGSVFWTWLVGMGAAQAWFNKSLAPQIRMGLLLVVATALFHGIVQRQDWASGWVPAVIALGIVASIKFPRTVFCASLAGGAAALFAAKKVLAGLLVHESYSLMTRLDAWHTLWAIIRKSPVFGVGMSNYYHFTQLYSTTGWYVKFSSHNNYIDLAAQTGFVGLFLFLCFGMAAMVLVFRLRAEVSGDFERAYVIGCLGCLVASLASGMLGDWLIPFVYNVGLAGFRSSLLFWVFLGGALALWNLRHQRGPESAPESAETLPSPLTLEGGYGPLELEPPL